MMAVESGSGLADGEQMERLWSYLHKFRKLSKEMTPSHRVDTLTYSSERVKEKQGMNI